MVEGQHVYVSGVCVCVSVCLSVCLSLSLSPLCAPLSHLVKHGARVLLDGGRADGVVPTDEIHVRVREARRILGDEVSCLVEVRPHLVQLKLWVAIEAPPV